MKNITREDLNEILLEKFRRQYLDITGFSKEWVNMRIEQYKKEIEHESSQPHHTISFTEKYLNYNFKNKKVLIVGLGLSISIVNDFLKKGADIYGIEPDENRIDVQYINAKLMNIKEDKIKKGVAEKIPFDDNTFDFVYCYTVLEHVQNVRKSLSEMYRVLKKNGILFIETPDFNIPYEPHYKILFPYYVFGLAYFYSFLPAPVKKFLFRLILTIMNRPTNFLKTINFFNEKSLKKIFIANNWKFLQIFSKNSENSKLIFHKFYKNHLIQKNLWFYIFKD